MSRDHDLTALDRNRYLAVYLVISTLVALCGYGYYAHHRHISIVEKEAELSAIADLKAREISQWRKERLADATSIYANAPIAHRVNDYLHGRESTRALAEIRAWMAAIQSSGYSSAGLFRPDGGIILAIAHSTLDRSDLGMIGRAAASQRVIFNDFHRGLDPADLHLDLVIPIRYLDGGASRTIAVLTLEIDPNTFLFPFIQSWPSVSASGETLLVKREGDEVVFLNRLRHGKNLPLSLRLPMSRGSLPAARAVRGV